ncbi:MAG: hypothetical protein ROO73_05150 [Roseivirga sp.]
MRQLSAPALASEEQSKPVRVSQGQEKIAALAFDKEEEAHLHQYTGASVCSQSSIES